jgi:ATP/maltotriose-dependent transcriptional regulator MalT
MGALDEMRGDSDRAVASLEMSEQLLRRAGDNARLSGVIQFLGITAISHRDADEALRRFSESRDLARAENLPWTEATALSFLAEVKVASGDLAEVRSIAEEAEHRYQALRDPWGMARMEKLLAGIAWVEGDYPTAHRLCEKAIGPLRAVGERWNLSRTLTRMGIILLDEGLHVEAERLFMEGLVGWRDLANDDGMVLCVAGLAAAAAGRGAMDRARRLYATEPLQRSDVQVHLDTLSEREFSHLMDLIRTALPVGREIDNRVVSLGETVSYALEGSPAARAGQSG